MTISWIMYVSSIPYITVMHVYERVRVIERDHMGKEQQKHKAKADDPEEAAWKLKTQEHRQIKADLHARVERVELTSLVRKFGGGSGEGNLLHKSTIYSWDVEEWINPDKPNEEDIHRALEIFKKSSANQKHGLLEGPATIPDNLEPHLFAIFPLVGEKLQIEISLAAAEIARRTKSPIDPELGRKAAECLGANLGSVLKDCSLPEFVADVIDQNKDEFTALRRNLEKEPRIDMHVIYSRVCALHLRDSASLWAMHEGLKAIVTVSEMKQFDEVTSRSGEIVSAAQFALAKGIFGQFQEADQAFIARISGAYTKIQENV